MNIALFLEQPFDPNAGGAQRSTSKLAEIYKSFGHNVILISSSQSPSIVSSWLEMPIFQINIKNDASVFRQILIDNAISLIINNAGESMKSTQLLLKNKGVHTKLINILRINPTNFYDNHKDYIL